MKDKEIDKAVKKAKGILDKHYDKMDEFMIKKANIIVDFFDDIVRDSVKRGFRSMSNSLLLKYVDDARELANQK